MTFTGVPDWQDPSQQQGGFDLLVSAAVLVSGGSPFTIPLGPMQALYSYLLISVAANSPANNECCAYIEGGGVGTITSVSIPNSQAVNQAFCYYGGPIGDAPNLVLAFQNQLTANGSVTVVGVRKGYVPPSAVGAWPVQNSLTSVWGAAQASTTIIPAPPANVQLLIGAIVPPAVVPQSSATIGILQGTLNGRTAVLARYMANSIGFWEWTAPGYPGILLDPATAVTTSASAAITSSVAGGVYYDLVSV